MKTTKGISEVNKSILQILDEARELLLPDTTAYQAPNRVFLSCNFLAPVNFEGTISDLEHYFNDDVGLQKWTIENCKIHKRGTSVILYGHSEYAENSAFVQPCAAPHFCHLIGYRPDATNSPAFRRGFQQKWGYLYEQRG